MAGERVRAGSSQSSAPHAGDPGAYWLASMRPLHVLVFLLPLIIAYEIGSVVYLTDSHAGVRQTIKAQKLLDDFFQAFGVVGLFVPGFALVTVLIVWHILSADPWRVRWRLIGGMFAESIAWTLPLLVMAAATGRAAQAAVASGWKLAQTAGTNLSGVSGSSPTMELASQTWQTRLTVSIGAGLYEEMLFRMVGIAALHFIIRDLIGASERVASICAVAGTALAFTLYHQPAVFSGGGGAQSGAAWALFAFYVLAGVYLGTIYLLRGFGIVVGAHALYDVLVLVPR